MTTNDPRPQYVLGGVRIDLVGSPQAALEEIMAHARSATARALAVASVNLDHVHHFARKPWLFEDDPVGWLCLLDGSPVVRRVREVTGESWPRLAGSDLLDPVLERCASDGVRVGFLGGSEQTHGALRAVLEQRLPTLSISGMWAPARSELTEAAASEALAGRVRDAGTELLVVCLGKPLQETWIAHYGVRTGARVSLAFGAAIDFLAGTSRRAPEAVQNAGVEWMWRFAHEPARLSRRYLIDGPRALASIHRWASPAASRPSALARTPVR